MISNTVLRSAALAACAISVVLVPLARALPANPDLPNWRGASNNCYNYALNKKDNDRKQPGNYQWPEGVGSSWSEVRWCAKMDSLSRADNLVPIPWQEGNPIPAVGADTNLVALAVHLGGKGTAGPGDFHWYRKNGDGSWSQKHGGDPATTQYRDDMNQRHPLTDPTKKAQREGYDLFCGFYGVLKSTNTTPQQHLEPPPGGCLILTLYKSGPEERHSTVTTVPGLQALHAHMPTLSPSNQIPDPQWLTPFAGEPRGFAVWPYSPSLGFPPYLRVFEGAVAVYSDLEGTNITYYTDDHGLGAYLGPTAGAPATGPWSTTALALLLLTAGAAFVVGRGRLARGES